MTTSSSESFERSLTIEKVIETAIPISELKRSVPASEIAKALDVQVSRLASNFNLKWNLSEGQIRSIVLDLLDQYPNEALEDFILVFKNAKRGHFGEIYRLDSAVIFSWVTQYLDDKYDVVEKKLMEAKESFHKPTSPGHDATDWLKIWRANIDSIAVKSVLPLTTEEIIKEGQVDPKKEMYPSTSLAEIKKRELHIQWIKENYDARTGDKLPTWTPEQTK